MIVINQDQYSEPLATDDEWDDNLHFRRNIDSYRITKEYKESLRGEP